MKHDDCKYMSMNGRDRMGISKEKMQTIIENCFNAECNIATIHDAFERGFRVGMQEGVQHVVHGEWIDTGSGQVCSVCGEIQYGYDSGRHYCANCGVKMDKRKGEDNESD